MRDNVTVARTDFKHHEPQAFVSITKLPTFICLLSHAISRASASHALMLRNQAATTFTIEEATVSKHQPERTHVNVITTLQLPKKRTTINYFCDHTPL